MRRFLWIALFALTPLAGYECVEKSAEHLRMTGWVCAASLQAERDTAWQLRGRGNLLDHTRHELAESRRFYRLAGRQILRRLRN